METVKEKSNITNLFILTYNIYLQEFCVFTILCVNCVILTFRDNEYWFNAKSSKQHNDNMLQ